MQGYFLPPSLGERLFVKCTCIILAGLLVAGCFKVAEIAVSLFYNVHVSWAPEVEK